MSNLVENTFKTITSEREYITKEEMSMADYCLARMKGYTDPKTGQEIKEAFDYMEFMHVLFSMNGK